MTKSVCVIGAGISGISAVKSLVEEGLNPTCYETRKDVGISALFKRIPDAGIPQELYSTLRSGKVFSSGRKEAMESDGERRGKLHYHITGIRLCNDLHWGIRKDELAKYEGLNRDEFKGQIMHSCEYESADEFEGLDVLIIGLGSCGSDVAADVSRSARKTVLSTRSGAYVIPRSFKNGVPMDVMIMSRITTTLEKILPTWVGDWMVKKFMISGINHKVLGIESKYSPTCPVATMLVSDDLAPRIICGKVAIKPDVKMATADEVYFVDGSKQRFDVVICATGFTQPSPFISDDILPDRVSDMKLFEWMIPFNIRDPSSLSVIGLIPFAPLGGIPRFECQTRFMAQVIAGLIDLPSREEMRKEFEKERSNFTQFEHLGRPFVFKGTMGMGYAYADRIAARGGFYPSLWSLIFGDPALALAVHFGPYVSYHYRLVGRHSNPEFARERTMNVMNNTLAGIPQSGK